MFLRCKVRKKNGKQHRSWSIVENKRVAGGRVLQKHVLYLGEINDSQKQAWRRSIEVFEEGRPRPKSVALFPEDRLEQAELQYRPSLRVGSNSSRQTGQVVTIMAPGP